MMDSNPPSDLDFHSVFAKSPAPSLVLDRRLFIVYANEAYLRTTMRSLTEIRDRYVFDAFPESGERTARFKAAFEQALAGDENVMTAEPFAVPVPESDGGGVREIVWTCTQTPVPGRSGQVEFVLQNALDVTAQVRAQQAQRQVEDRLRRVLETDTVGIVFYDETGAIIDANDVFLRMSGYSREQVRSGELHWRKLTPPEWMDLAEAEMEKLHGTGRSGPYEKEMFLAGGERVWMLIAGRSLGDGSMVKYCIDIGDRKRAEQERELLGRELSHRVKNTLAVVQALASQTRAPSIEAFREAFIGRLQALSRAHSLLIDMQWKSLGLRALVDQAIEAFRADRPNTVEVDGPPVQVTPKQGLGLSLVLHELGTNAAKYGAVSHRDGVLRIRWRVEERDDGPWLVLEWLERGGTATEPPAEKGFGTRLIERACAYELGGEVDIAWPPEGLTCTIAFPLD
ncbi:MAG: HWE histidine kinase domain-containing protein [Acetobacterales bacterium]